jgi:sugar-specific transcriptional regulator TrmB
MPKELLKDMGLKDNEIKLYLTLLKEGPSSVVRLSKATGVERSMCYQVINNLAGRGLISSSIRDNRKYFEAADPDHLFELLNNKEKELLIVKDRLSEKMPFFKGMMDKSKGGDFKVDVYTGSEGCKIVRLKVLNESEEYHVIGYHKDMKGFSKYWRENWAKERVKRKIKRNVIVSPAFKDAESLKQPYTSVRVLPNSATDETPMTTLIFGKDKVLISLPTEDEYYGLLITNKQVHDSYLSYFDVLWNLSPKQ